MDIENIPISYRKVMKIVYEKYIYIRYEKDYKSLENKFTVQTLRRREMNLFPNTGSSLQDLLLLTSDSKKLIIQGQTEFQYIFFSLFLFWV